MEKPVAIVLAGMDPFHFGFWTSNAGRSGFIVLDGRRMFIVAYARGKRDVRYWELFSREGHG
jgi:hypothetical protein